jgi:hypothetical protein
LAALATGTVPVALGFGAYWLMPWGCDANAWTCVLPLCLIWLGPVGAVVLPVVFVLNRRRRRPLPDGILPVMLAAGLAGQVAATLTALWLTEALIRRLFLWDVLILPQGFVAGAIVGAVFAVALRAATARRTQA